jgi:hypothetical protein
MQIISINWWAILVAVIPSFVVGGLWYSPALFLGSWLEMSGVSKPQFNAGFPRALLGDLVSAIIMALVLDHLIHACNVAGLAQGLFLAFCIWLGFVATILLGSVTYEHRPFTFFAINAGYRLITMLLMGAVLTLWG